ncbi:ATP-binding protein [Mycobacterium stomatepiae]|uniref:ATP-binding protein n=2 Tax=Mycobacterium stomatepiae TaxID=470076 RepID=A0A7I7QAS7_9MYCO|nr:ATP-binding protein [Mycobacterium stomatepiae]BBY23395.1 ATP-binding protein [Mycobacterium stomatepiae]
MLGPMTRPDPDPTTPLWRAAQVFRLLSCLYALGFQIAINPDLRRPALGWVLFAVLIGWSAACAIAYLRGFGRKPAWVVAELVIVVALMWSNRVITFEHWASENQTWPTTLWASNPTISAAIQLGPVRGMLTGLVVMATNFAVKNYFDLNMTHNASIIIELAIGMAIGLAAQTARRAHADLQRAAQLSAAVQERERLSREVHDGAIQVLALVAKRGHEIGGPTAELADLASEQERARRRWVTSTGIDEYGDRATIDLRTLLRHRESDRVSLSLPGTPVTLPRRVAAELAAAVGNALDNVSAHAGAGAHAFVLLEDLGDSVTVSVRDDGVGIADGRLQEAAEQGRLGISKSIVGRLESLGGSALLRSGAGEGTEWELSVPRDGGTK